MTSENTDEEIDIADATPDDALSNEGDGANGIRNPKILNLPVRIVVSVGNAHLTVQELLDLTPESVVDLDARIDDPAALYVGERLIARGELIEAGEDESGIGVRIVEICNSVS